MKYRIIFLSLIFSVSSFATPIHGIYKEEKEETSKTDNKDSNNRDSINKDSKQIHLFKEDVYREYNPLFADTQQQKIDLNYNYATTLGLSNTQTLIFNGMTTHYKYPLKWRKMQFKIFGDIAFGDTLITTQAIQKSVFFYGVNTGFHASMPLPIQDVVAHAVFGMDIGAGFLGNEAARMLVTSMLVDSYFGIDFLYDRYVFRPFINLSCIMPFSSLYDLYVAGMGSIGLKTFYRGDSVLPFVSLAFSTTFSQNNANVFVMLPKAVPFYVGSNALQLDFSAGMRYFTTQYLNVNAMVIVNYVANYYALNAGGQIGISFHF